MRPDDSKLNFSVREVLDRGLPQFLGFELLFRTAAALVFAPLVAWLAAGLIGFSGSGVISNYDIAGFLLSLHGQAYLAIVVSLVFAFSFFEGGGLFTLALSIHRGSAVRLTQLMRFLMLSFWKLWRLAARQFLIYMAIAVPCLAVVGITYLALLTKSDINYYLIAKPTEFRVTLAVAMLSAAAFLFFAGCRFIDWIFSVPLLLFTKAGPADAMKQSAGIARPHRKELLMMLLRWVALSGAVVLVFTLSIGILKWTFLTLAGDNVTLVLSFTSFLAVIQFVASVITGVLISSSLVCMITRRFVAWAPEPELPAELMRDDATILNAALRYLRLGWVVMAILAIMTFSVAHRIISTEPPKVETGITAHRGSSIAAPENTMAAILLAVEEGADYVEIDVQETRDGTVVLVHDKDLLRVFGIGKGVWEVSYDELKDLDSGGWFSLEFSDQRLATLDQVIKAVKGRAKLNIELKFNGHHKQLAKEVVRIVRENDFVDDCILTSLSFDGLERAREAGPEFRTGLIVTSALGDVTKLRGDLISVSAGAVTRDLIDRARRAGLEVHVWTVNDIARMNRMLGMGVDQIITDDPKLLAEVIAGRAGLSSSERMLMRLADIADNRVALK